MKERLIPVGIIIVALIVIGGLASGNLGNRKIPIDSNNFLGLGYMYGSGYAESDLG